MITSNQNIANETEAIRPLLVTYAYNILGTYEDACDAVQDTFVKLLQVDEQNIINKKAYLIRSVVNTALNQKEKQQRDKIHYTGEWLPEPIDTESAQSRLIKAEVLAYSVMVLLEKLDARQRAVFVLKEAYDYDHKEIAELLDISVENSRKILARAKAVLGDAGHKAKKDVQKSVVEKYLLMMKLGDREELEQMLKEDITVISDGGGKALAALKPSIGQQASLKLLSGLYNKYWQAAPHDLVWINHQPALFYYEDGIVTSCQVFIVNGDTIENVFIIRNPDKLKLLQK